MKTDNRTKESNRTHNTTRGNNMVSDKDLLIRIEENVKKSISLGEGIAEAIQNLLGELKEAIEVVQDEK